jgi:uncharacterized damage-inducible protein DinB
MPSQSPVSADSARRILGYNRTVFDRFERKIRRLPSKTAFQNREIGHESLFGTLVHILNVHDAWFNYVVPGRLREFLEIHSSPARHPTSWSGFEPYRRQVWAGETAFTDSLTDRTIARPVRAPWMPGRYTVGDAILQVSFEEAHHLGEIIGALWQVDIPSPEMTWIELREKAVRAAAPRHRRPRFR